MNKWICREKDSSDIHSIILDFEGFEGSLERLAEDVKHATDNDEISSDATVFVQIKKEVFDRLFPDAHDGKTVLYGATIVSAEQPETEEAQDEA